MKIHIHYDANDNRKPEIVDLPVIPSKGDEIVDREGMVANVEKVQFIPSDKAAQVHIFLVSLVPSSAYGPLPTDAEDEDDE